MQYVIALLFLCLLILIHEFGHFLFARLCGVYVNEFSIGMGPKLLQKTSKKSGTKYSIRLIPIGGYCAMKGESVGSDGSEDADSFSAAAVWKRMLIIAAGPVFNLLLGFVLALILVLSCGQDVPYVTNVTSSEAIASGLQKGDVIVNYNGHAIGSSREFYFHEWYDENSLPDEVTVVVDRDGERMKFVYPVTKEKKYAMGVSSGTTEDGTLLVLSFLKDSPAEAAGLQEGDEIIAIDGQKPTKEMSLADYLEDHPFTENEATLTYLRDGVEGTVSFYPQVTVLKDSGFGYNTQRIPSQHVLRDVVSEVRYDSVSVVKSLTGLVTGRFGLSDMSGPVGIVKTLGDNYETAVTESSSAPDYSGMIALMGLLTVNLGLFNLLPIPALDGSHLVFLIIEAIRRKRMKPQIQNGIQTAGLMVILILSVGIILKDFWQIFF